MLIGYLFFRILRYNCDEFERFIVYHLFKNNEVSVKVHSKVMKKFNFLKIF